MKSRKGALVIFSGGQDSTTCLHYALQRYPRVEAVTFYYKQRHSREIECAKIVAARRNVPHTLLEIPKLEGKSPLVNENEQVGQYRSTQELPGGIEPTFVPGRNLIFLALATNIAAARDLDTIVTGVSQEDYGGYPDCRDSFIQSMKETINLALGNSGHDDLTIVPPLIYLNKKKTVELARSLGPECWEDLAWSHTCYNGTEVPCLSCHACLLRIRGFIEAGEVDPLLKRLGIKQPETV